VSRGGHSEEFKAIHPQNASEISEMLPTLLLSSLAARYQVTRLRVSSETSHPDKKREGRSESTCELRERSTWRQKHMIQAITRAKILQTVVNSNLLAILVFVTLAAAIAMAQDVLPRPELPFQGHVGRTVQDSTLDFPQEVKAPKGAPNILLILTDDVGFGATSTFGGPVPTPTFDRLAANGLRYTAFHTTALCSPTRSALLTGRNHHSNATGVIMELATGFPGYNSLMPKTNGTFTEVLKQKGYNAAWYGKNHNVPDWHSSQAGPCYLWPTGLGFEYFYGFVGGDTTQWRRHCTRTSNLSSRRATKKTIFSRRIWPTRRLTAFVCCTRLLPTNRG
jgi:hypothetical protein